MGFEYDPAKSHENKRKHGIDFEEARALWDDPALVEIPARASDEPRWLLIGKINLGKADEKLWSAFITRRGENVRLISVRRSREKEAALYESQDTGSDV
ncbi:MAG TPA: BrnT family toxin [Candidatus Dormibacteraeota bacterium]|jgi:uncharacterized DUF497 family protein|nr:BrnT family toxin [Candidatus Dormibacteraeota bacterium]